MNTSYNYNTNTMRNIWTFYYISDITSSNVYKHLKEINSNAKHPGFLVHRQAISLSVLIK